MTDDRPAADAPAADPARARAARGLLRGAARSARRPRALLVLASVTGALGTFCLPYALGRAVDAVLGLAPPSAGPFPGAADLTWPQATVALVALVVVAEAVIACAAGATTARATAWLRHGLLAHAVAAGPGLTRRISAGDLVSRGSGNAAQAGAAPAGSVAVWAAGIPAVGATVMLFRIDIWCGVTFLAGLVLLGVVLAALVRRATDGTVHYQDAQGRIAAGLTDALAGARTIAAAGTTEAEVRRILAPLPELRRHGASIWQAQASGLWQAALLVQLLEVGVLAVAGWQLGAGRLSVGDLLSAAAYVVLAAELAASLGAAVALAQARGAAARCADVHAVPPTSYGTACLPPGPGALELDRVHLAGAAGGRPVLDGVSVVVPGGSTLAVVGSSGSGKSAFAALLGRLAEPDSGTVRLDGVAVADLSEDELHGAVTYAFARPALLGRTVAGTIALGTHAPDAAALGRAARDACADAFIARLPLGYDTAIAHCPLSGGEAQRLGLARAFAHAGRVLVLDDATSSLDTVTERQVTEALASRLPGRTRVIVAHRASTAARADAVLWLADGRVRGHGPHTRLWADPAYRAVFAAASASA